MDTETTKRLKAWFYLRLPPEHWTRFGENAEAVLRTFDDDPDQENALLEFANVIVLSESQHDLRIVHKWLRELEELGIDRQQFAKVAQKMLFPDSGH
jgi:hypothetical protein